MHQEIVMQKMLIPLLIAVFACTAAASGAAGDTKAATIALITKMETDRIQAGVRKDVAAIAAATDEDYMQIDLDGVVRDKAAAMQRIASSEIQLQSNTVDEMRVRIYGDTAVVTSRATPAGMINGKAFPQIRGCKVYVKRAGTWKVVFFQMTRVAQR
jgi:hypothetical protein